MRPVHALIGLCAIVLAVGTSSAFAPAFAQANDSLAVGGQASTLGFGPEIAYSVSPTVTVRGVGNYLAYDYDQTVDGIDYDLGLDLVSGGGFLDYHPMRNGFHLSVGALYNGNEADLTATAPAGSTVGGFTVPADTSLRGDLEFSSTIAPYLGIGYDTTFTSRNNWSFVMRAGVLYQGDPEVTLTESSGSVPAADLAAEAEQIEDELDLLRFYPVVSVGVTYRF